MDVDLEKSQSEKAKKETAPRAPFEKLDAYLRAEALADAVWRMVYAWPMFARDSIGKQLVRAADRIGAMIAAGAGHKSRSANRRMVRAARGALYETKHWLRRAYRRKLITPDQVTSLKKLVDELLPAVNAHLASITRRRTPLPSPSAAPQTPPSDT